MKTRFSTALAVTALCVSFAACHRKHAPVASTPPASTPHSAELTPGQAPPTPHRAPSRPVETASNTTPRMPNAETRAQIQELLNRIQDAFFDYDKHTLRPDAEVALRKDVQTLTLIIK